MSPIGPNGVIIVVSGDISNQNNAKGTVTAFNPDLTIKWRIELGAGLVSYKSSITISNGLLFIPMVSMTSKSCSLFAVNAKDGSLSWSEPFVVSNSMAIAPPSVSHSGNTIYWTSYTNLYAINSRTGSLLWTFNLASSNNEMTTDIEPYGITTLIDASGTLYVGGYDTCTIYALVDDGSRVSIKWQYSTNGYTGFNVNYVPNKKPGCFSTSIIMGSEGTLL